jgi:lipoyl(octanoyl) transferase
VNAVVNRKTHFQDLGLMEFKACWDYQDLLFNRILSVKRANRDRLAVAQEATENYLLFVEHPHVYTLGKSGNVNNLLIHPHNLHTINADYYHINRGGDITYHGPGQIVGYPVLDLENFFTDIHRYMRSLEEAVILTLHDFGIPAGRIPGMTGVWVEPEEARARKICALGVRASRWVTLHGFALNVNTDLTYFDHIIPCGIRDKAVTSMAKETGSEQSMAKVSAMLKEKVAEVFDMEWI